MFSQWLSLFKTPAQTSTTHDAAAPSDDSVPQDRADAPLPNPNTSDSETNVTTSESPTTTTESRAEPTVDDWILTNTRRMCAMASSCSYYISDYIGKHGEVFVSLMDFLRDGIRRLNQQKPPVPPQNDTPDDEYTKTLKKRVGNILTRMVTASNKRVHMPLPSILEFLLQRDEKVSSHEFVNLAFGPFLFALRHELRGATPGAAVADEPIEYAAPSFVGGDSDTGTVRLTSARENYYARPHQCWRFPLYFFSAGVSTYKRQDTSALRFLCCHTKASEVFSQEQSLVFIVPQPTPWR